MIPKKFRAWISGIENTNREMFYQSNQCLSSFIQRVISRYCVEHSSNLTFELETTLMQSTGLFDTNHVEIYESDLVTLPYQSSKGMVFEVTWNQRTANFEASNVVDPTIGRFFNKGGDGFTIVGNVHETKETK